MKHEGNRFIDPSLGTELYLVPGYNQRKCNTDNAENFNPSTSIPIRIRNQMMQLAKSLCRDCVIQEECLMTAVSNHEQFGVWGGVNMEELTERKRALRYFR